MWGKLPEGSFSEPLPLAFDTQLPYAGSVSPRRSYYHITDLQPNSDYFINLDAITDTVILRVYSNAEFSGPAECGAWGDIGSEAPCFATSDEDGNLWLEVDGQESIAGASYQISAALYVGPY